MSKDKDFTAESVKKPPLAWAHELGFFKRYGRGPEARTLPLPKYAAANVHYGWDKKAHFSGPESLLLSQKDFEAAMSASENYPTVELHGPAIAALHDVPAAKPQQTKD